MRPLSLIHSHCCTPSLGTLSWWNCGDTQRVFSPSSSSPKNCTWIRKGRKKLAIKHATIRWASGVINAPEMSWHLTFEFRLLCFRMANRQHWVIPKISHLHKKPSNVRYHDISGFFIASKTHLILLLCHTTTMPWHWEKGTTFFWRKEC